MPISPYIRELRASIGTRRLLLPSVSAHIFDSSRRLLLVKHTLFPYTTLFRSDRKSVV